MPRRLDRVLADYGVELGVASFRDVLTEAHFVIAPSWTDEELMHHPRVAAEFCDRVRQVVNSEELPDPVILRALSGIRKHRLLVA